MPDYQALTPQQHANLRWKRYSSYQFANKDAVAPLVIQELPQACMHLPIAFMHTAAVLTTVAVQGLQPGENLIVATNGNWSLGYVPASYRSYPFALLPSAENTYALCINTASDLLGTEGEAVFDSNQQPTQAIQEVLNFLQQVAQNTLATQQLCQQLHTHQLLQPWPLSVQTPQGQQRIEGLLRIDENALKTLDAASLHALQQSGALQMAYMQLLSMQHISKLVQLAHTRQLAAQEELMAHESLQGINELDLEFLNQDGTLTFSNF